MADFPQSQWESLGIWVRRPLYATGAYNNSLCPARDSEKELFHLRQSRDDRPVRESAQLLLGADGINEEKVRWSLKDALLIWEDEYRAAINFWL